MKNARIKDLFSMSYKEFIEKAKECNSCPKKGYFNITPYGYIEKWEYGDCESKSGYERHHIYEYKEVGLSDLETMINFKKEYGLEAAKKVNNELVWLTPFEHFLAHGKIVKETHMKNSWGGCINLFFSFLDENGDFKPDFIRSIEREYGLKKDPKILIKEHLMFNMVEDPYYASMVKGIETRYQLTYGKPFISKKLFDKDVWGE